jgi:hypothetical protein
LVALVALQTALALVALFPLEALQTALALDALIPLEALQPALALDALITLETLQTTLTLDALLSLETALTLDALIALEALQTAFTLDALLALDALKTALTLDALIATRPGHLRYKQPVVRSHLERVASVGTDLRKALRARCAGQAGGDSGDEDGPRRDAQDDGLALRGHARAVLHQRPDAGIDRPQAHCVTSGSMNRKKVSELRRRTRCPEGWLY